jgi:RimJ/RimL family protein N-acetyltransferase
MRDARLGEAVSRLEHTAGASQTSSKRIEIVDWKRGAPMLSDSRVTLREVTARDAASLVRQLGTPAVCKYMTPPPADEEGFRRFIRWAQTERRHGRQICYAVVPAGCREAIGLIQLWRLDVDFSLAEWGVAIGEAWWGRRIASAAGALLFEFAFGTLKVLRLEARATVGNERGQRLMARLGATHECTLRRSFHRGAQVEDHEMWVAFGTGGDVIS